MEQRLTIITLGVRDLKISQEFYTEKFDWEKLDLPYEEIVFLKLNGILLSLCPQDKLAEDAQIKIKQGTDFNNTTFAYNTRSEAEVDELIEKLEKKGVQIVKRPHKAFWGGYSSYITDPDQYLWEIAYNPFLSLDNLSFITPDK